jgi:hypothetical protein
MDTSMTDVVLPLFPGSSSPLPITLHTKPLAIQAHQPYTLIASDH